MVVGLVGLHYVVASLYRARIRIICCWMTKYKDLAIGMGFVKMVLRKIRGSRRPKQGKPELMTDAEWRESVKKETWGMMIDVISERYVCSMSEMRDYIRKKGGRTWHIQKMKECTEELIRFNLIRKIDKKYYEWSPRYSSISHCAFRVTDKNPPP